MNARTFGSIACILLASNTVSYAQTDTVNKATPKSGWSFGAVPVIAYESDIGFKYGGLVNFYHYGDGTIYPEYKHSIYLEWSRTTKGSGINQIIYDSKYLIPKIRVSGEISFLTEKALDFYGFNGYKAFYDVKYEDDAADNSDYLSRVFYRLDRKLIRLRADFQGKIKDDKLKWVGGIVHYHSEIDTVDINNLNKGQSADKILYPTGGGLYGRYQEMQIIPEEQINGGSSTFFKIGVIFDTRDNEPNPMHGMWSDISFFIDPGFLSESKAYGRYTLTHRQYFTLVPDRLSFAYRIIYQGKLFGNIPTYMLPFLLNSGRYNDRDGFGGAKTIRGILRDRVVGDDIVLGNFELRWKFVKTVILKQNVYLALSAFTDMGQVTQDYSINTSHILYPEFFPNTKESLHQSVGGGFRVALNENFIVAVDYGIALDKRDGDKGLYINLDWLF
jgi:hypothetical protein